MSILTIRAAIAVILDAIPQIKKAEAYPPDKIGPLPVAFCGLNDESIDYTAGTKISDHILPVVVLVQRTPDRLSANLADVEALQALVVAALESNISLGAADVSIALPSRVQQDQIQIGQVPYIGFVLTLNVTEKSGITLP